MTLSTAQPSTFLIADISGYTGYLADVELEHAQDILADLIGAVVSALRPNFRLAKLEGDAAFMYATGETVDGSMLLDTIERCYFGFRRRRRDVRQATSCECNACARIPDLDLKFVVHHGAAILQKVAGRQELLGSDVIVAHRLLKNEVVEKLGIAAYALISQTMHRRVRHRPGRARHARALRDLRPDRRGAGLGSRSRASLAGGRGPRAGPGLVDESILIVSVPTNVPPQVAWEFLTKPGQRMSWQPWVTEVTIKGATGGRRGPGSANHCMHGKDAVIEEILDWRPYDYVTDRTILETPERPGEGAPHDRVRARRRRHRDPLPLTAAPKTRREKALMKVIAPAYGAALRVGPARASSPSSTPHSRLVRRTAAPSPSWSVPGPTARCPVWSRWRSSADRRPAALPGP